MPGYPCPERIDGIHMRRTGDIIHFSSKGSRVVADWLLDAWAKETGR